MRKELIAGVGLLFVGVAIAKPALETPTEYVPPPGLVSSQTVQASWNNGLNVDGRRIAAQPASTPVRAFLEAHSGQDLVIRLDAVRTEGGVVERIGDARLGRLTAAAWWDDLSSRQQRQAAAGQPAGDSLVVGMMHALAPMASAAASPTRYVSPVGSDTNDGLTPATPYLTVGRALSDISALVDDNWTIRLAAGEYPETVELRRFSMPATLSTQQLRDEPISRAISLVGEAGTVIVPSAGRPCLSAAGVVLFLDTLTCRAANANGISASGATVVFDDVKVEATAAAAHAVYAETSLLYFGGSFVVEGPFSIGIAARTNGLARTGTRRNPAVADMTFSGLTAQAIFVRDGGNFTSAFESGTIRVANSGQAIYALLGSQVFLSSGMSLEMENVNIGIVATQRSAVNVHSATLVGPMPNPFVRCFLGSYLVLEIVSAAPTRPADTDGTCSAFTF